MEGQRITVWCPGRFEVRHALPRGSWIPPGVPVIGSAVCNLAHIACVRVDDHDPAHALVDPLAKEGHSLPIGRPRRALITPALWGVGDLADMATVWVHREDRCFGLLGIEVAAKDDLTVPGRSTARALVVFVFVIACSTGERRESHGYDH